jgi:aminocarboxymuconate-semialdehyde decarboxylase
MPVIDIHTHMFGHAWRDMIVKHGGEDAGFERMDDGRDYIMERGAPAGAADAEGFDYDLRVKRMDTHGIDLAVVSLTSPNVFWGSADISAQTARLSNDEMAAGQTAYPDRIRFLANLPWEHPDLALTELDRAMEIGAVGVMVLANINGRHLIDPLFEPIWRALDKRALPVLVHPTAPLGARLAEFGKERVLMPSVGFMYDTTLAIARMVIDGFFDRFEKVRIIAAHGGGYLPYVADRIDVFFGVETLVERKIERQPSEYLRDIYYDALVYHPGALNLCIELAGADAVMFGTDFPMPADIPKLHDISDSLPGKDASRVKGANAVQLFNL